MRIHSYGHTPLELITYFVTREITDTIIMRDNINETRKAHYMFYCDEMKCAAVEFYGVPDKMVPIHRMDSVRVGIEYIQGALAW